MQALPSTNPLSWAYQAAIHGTTLPGSFPAWNTCQHGTHYFWSWHRMYLYWFERIIRKMSGDSNFALPYWNYELATERQLPAPFRNSGSPLFTSNRGAGWNSGAASLSSSAVAISGFMPTIPYYNAQSGCEGTPHGAVHVSIGWAPCRRPPRIRSSTCITPTSTGSGISG
jgi:tyrosinase-like protein